VCGEAAYVLLSKRMSARVGTSNAAFWMQAFSALFLLPLAAPSFAPEALAGMSWRIGMLLVFHSITASVISVLLWYRGMRRVPASLAGIFTALLPATAGLTAVLLLDEAVTGAHVAGFALLLLSILLATPL
jgi:drug/metabolite transporter (DMT)-like permease